MVVDPEDRTEPPRAFQNTALTLKDAVRVIRHAIRRKAQRPPDGVSPVDLLGRVPRRVARAADGVLSGAEQVMRGIVTDRTAQRPAFPQPIAAYWNRPDGQRLFVKSTYRAAKAYMAERHGAAPLVYENAIAAAWDEVRHRVAAAEAKGRPIHDPAALSAALTVSLVRHRAIHGDEALNLEVFAALGFATAAASLTEQPIDASLSEILALAADVVAAHRARLLDALKSPEPVESIAAEYRLFAPHLL
ncbi:hypothetical protein [Chthonobacter albigriseus]|uniref:hypothetical protein n=1 Tax=Chthonobacter albigriseus TaxID=1683161 RepID=UPI0015EF36B6|nr:hypothetical protein [Chthonobacter albigriseus]